MLGISYLTIKPKLKYVKLKKKKKKKKNPEANVAISCLPNLITWANMKQVEA
ncbi:hypothetical protein GX48_05548 [Paracoccidioides brasiliensis]|nr:hypothetical protein GX48_05548 [Paracoccidioides brasiliensis]